MSLLEPGVRGVEFGDRGVDVFDVEPHLQRDSAFLVEAVQLEHLVVRRPGTHIGSAQLQSGEGQALASDGDNRVTVIARRPSREESSLPRWPFARRRDRPA